MLSNKRYQVFVSSTQADLRDEREAIINSLTKIGYIAVGMEQFPATDEEQMDYIRPVIDESDYYIVVIKGRYGSVGADGISYTEKEFRYAVETKKPALAFLYKDMKTLFVGDTDDDPDKLRKLHAFRGELEQKRIVNYWLNSAELVGRVKDSINDLVRRKPAIGWIRGDQALDPDVYRERDELRKQVEILSQRIAHRDEDKPENLVHGIDEIDIHYSIGVQKRVDGSLKKAELVLESKISKSCDDIISIVMDDLYSEPSENKIGHSIREYIANNIAIDRSEFGIGEKGMISIVLLAGLMKNLRHHFEALGLIDGVMMDYRDRYREEMHGLCWRLTDKGRAYIANMYAFKKPLKA